MLNSNTGLARRSPLARFWGDNDYASVSVGSVSVQELPFQGVIRLQCRACSPKFMEIARDILGYELPQQANTFAGDSVVSVWASPNEWILVTPAGEDEALAEQLLSRFEAELDVSFAVTVITDGRSVLQISGASASTLISKGCTLDLRHEKFADGQCASSLLEQVPMTLYRTAKDNFIVLVDRSYAAFTWEWLAHALREFKYVEAV